MSEQLAALKTIKSFVLRQGRMTQGQQMAFDQLWPTLGLEPMGLLNSQQVFGREAPLIVEIGFGNGESLATMAEASPDQDFIGIEVHRPGVGHLLLRIKAFGLKNVRIYNHDAVAVLRDCIPVQSLTGIQVFFPDPWHKKRHHKRRLINSEFVGLLAERLKSGGWLHCATDWEDYAMQMLKVLEECPQLKNRAGDGLFSPKPDTRPVTKFETRGHRLGHGVWDLIFEKV